MNSEQLFVGNAKGGNIAEALDAAIYLAKETMKTSIVAWELASIKGVSGGFIDKNDVEVSIKAHVPLDAPSA